MPSQRQAPRTKGGLGEGGPRLLKKYPNRRLYDTFLSSYITLTDVKRMVLAGEAFEVRDAKTSEDLTRSILLQIILEEELNGVPIFSTPMLAQIIRFYGHAMQGMAGALLERNLQAFVELQGQLVGGNAPAFQKLMTAYMDQTRGMWDALQEQVGQTRSMFPVFPDPKR
jgi:polyhydroxyalkanoate synthesis repressor PhaR